MYFEFKVMFRASKNIFSKQNKISVNKTFLKKYSIDANLPTQAEVVIIGKLYFSKNFRKIYLSGNFNMDYVILQMATANFNFVNIIRQPIRDV